MMTKCKWNREQWKEDMVRALDSLMQSLTVEPYGLERLTGERYRELAENAKTDEQAKLYFDHFIPELNTHPTELIDLLCQHPGMQGNTGDTGYNLMTYVVMPGSSHSLQLRELARCLTKSAQRHGSSVAVERLETFLSLNAAGQVTGYEICVFRGLSLSGEIEIAPGLEIIDYQHAVKRGLVKVEHALPGDPTRDYAYMGALVLVRKMSWGPCLVHPRTFYDNSVEVTPNFQWAPGCGTGIVFDLLSVCTSQEIQILFITCNAPEFVDLIPNFVSGTGMSYIHSEYWLEKEFAEEHVGQLQSLLQLWSQFKSDKRETLELAINRLSSSIHRNRGRFWLQDRILDAAISLEIMYQLDPPEITYKLATRAAYLLAKTEDERAEIFDQIHTFYVARSKIAHGAARKRKGKKKPTNFQKSADLGFKLASETLQALLVNGEFPDWNKLVLSPWKT